MVQLHINRSKGLLNTVVACSLLDLVVVGFILARLKKLSTAGKIIIVPFF